MLRRICTNPPIKHFKLQFRSLGHATSDNFEQNKQTDLLRNRCSLKIGHVYSFSSYQFDELSFETNRKFIASSTILKCKRPSVFSQKRNFSYQSSIQTVLSWQFRIFKIISESTPVEYCQKYLLLVHDFTGLPWWSSIILSTIIIRTVVTLPLAVYQHDITARLENLKQELPAIAEELSKETTMAVHLFKWDEKTAKAAFNRSMKNQWNNLVVRDNCHPLKTTILIWFQLPLWVSLSVSLRNLVYMLPVQDANAQLTLTELMVGGFAFIPNLAMPDYSWIFPITLGILNLAIVEVQILCRDQSANISKLQKIFTNLFRVISIVMIPIAAAVPSCLALYWTTSSAYGLAQNLVLMSPRVRRFVRIPETVVEVKHPYKLVITNLKSKLRNIKLFK